MKMIDVVKAARVQGAEVVSLWVLVPGGGVKWLGVWVVGLRTLAHREDRMTFAAFKRKFEREHGLAGWDTLMWTRAHLKPSVAVNNRSTPGKYAPTSGYCTPAGIR